MSDRRMNLQAIAGGSAAPGHAPGGHERRVHVRRIADKLGGFSLSPDSNAAMMKKFLRPGS